MPLRKIRIRSNERVFIAGQSRSGKSYLARSILRQFSRLIVLDSKGDLGDWGLEEASDGGWKRLEKGQAARLRVSKPVGAPQQYWIDAMVRAYEAGNDVIYIDEVSQIFRTPDPPDVVWDIWQRGGVFGVGGFAASQRPSSIPLIMMSEANHFFMFRLNLLRDRKRMAEFMGDEVVAGIPPGDRHGFFYRHIDMLKPVYIRRLAAASGDGKSLSLTLEEGKYGQQEAESARSAAG
jgi:DNA helicase HerA-like ATPase